MLRKLCMHYGLHVVAPQVVAYQACACIPGDSYVAPFWVVHSIVPSEQTGHSDTNYIGVSTFLLPCLRASALGSACTSE